MTAYILMANTTVTAIDYPTLVGVILLILAGVLYVRHIRSKGWFARARDVAGEVET